MVKAFISYKRQPSAMLANLIKCKLQSQRINFFLDVENLGLGQFPEQLRQNIKSSHVVVCLLGETTLESPYVGNEIREAASLKKLMIPVFQEGFKQPQEPREDSLNWLLQHNGVHIRDVLNQGVDDDLRRLGQLIQQAQGVKPPVKVSRRLRLAKYRVREIHPPIAVPPTGDGMLLGRVQVVLEGNAKTFDEHAYRSAMSQMLAIASEKVNIVNVTAGSIRVDTLLPWGDALRMYFMYVGSGRGFSYEHEQEDKKRGCPRCHNARSFLLGVLLILLGIAGVQAANGELDVKLPTLPAINLRLPSLGSSGSTPPPVTTRPPRSIRTPSRTPRPPATTRPASAPGGSGSGQSAPVIPTATPTPTDFPTITPTDPPPPAELVVTPFQDPYFNPASDAPVHGTEPDYGYPAVYAGSKVTFYSNDFANICRVDWTMTNDIGVYSTDDTYPPRFETTFPFDDIGYTQIQYDVFICDEATSYLYSDSLYFFVESVPPTPVPAPP